MFFFIFFQNYNMKINLKFISIFIFRLLFIKIQNNNLIATQSVSPFCLKSPPFGNKKKLFFLISRLKSKKLCHCAFYFISVFIRNNHLPLFYNFFFAIKCTIFFMFILYYIMWDIGGMMYLQEWTNKREWQVFV